MGLITESHWGPPRVSARLQDTRGLDRQVLGSDTPTLTRADAGFSGWDQGATASPATRRQGWALPDGRGAAAVPLLITGWKCRIFNYTHDLSHCGVVLLSNRSRYAYVLCISSKCQHVAPVKFHRGTLLRLPDCALSPKSMDGLLKGSIEFKSGDPAG